jgi:flagellar hook-associated protein FlgK
MSDLLGISGNAVMAYQLALGAVSNNIANVGTDGYSRQAVQLQSGTPRQIGNASIGTGVVFERVKRQYDAFAESNLRNSNSDLQSQLPMVSYTNRVIDVMGGQSSGLVSSLDQFFASARALSTDPASTVLRGGFMRDAQGVAARFGQLAGQLDLVDSETREAVNSSLGKMNILTEQISAVNKQLSKNPTVERQPPELLDQRDRLLLDLSQYARLNTKFSTNGTVNVSLGASITQDVVVNGQTAVRIGADFNAAAPEKIGLVLDPYGTPSALSGVTSGELAGLLTFREQVLGSTRSALDFVADKLVNEVNAIHREGVDAYGRKGGDLFAIDPSSATVAGGISVVLDDPLRIAAAAQFRVNENASNTGSANAHISYAATASTGPLPLDQALANNPNGSSAKSFALPASGSFAPVASVSAGMKDVVIYLDGASGSQQINMLTRDGRHLLGASLSATQQSSLLTQKGFEPGASYSSQYLGVSGADGYKDMTVFYGARAEVRAQQTFVFDESDGVRGKVTAGVPLTLPAQLSGERMTAGLTGFAEAKLMLNGQALPALTPAGASLQASEVASWLSAAGAASGISARAFNEVSVPLGQIKLDRPLVLNGTEITLGGSSDANALVVAINDNSATTGVQASISGDGQLVLSNTEGYEGDDILIESTLAKGSPNALNLNPGIYAGRIELTRDLVAGEETPIEISFAADGKPADLASLGFRTGAYLSGAVPDDVQVFVTGESGSPVKVSASYSGTPADQAAALRTQPMQIEFLTGASAGGVRYQITDVTTGTVLAERELDPKKLLEGIHYQGLTVGLSAMPKVGDRFVIDGNSDGTGNNDNILRMAALESKRLVGGTKTLSGAYIDHVNEMGNISRQASIAKDALSVVHDQAAESRDQVSGVSLDEEAANLIRFQQAYQASAKVMQIASSLFDSVLQVR